MVLAGWVYFLCSVTGLLLYGLPIPFFNSFGIRFYVYAFYAVGLNEEIPASLGKYFLILVLVEALVLLTVGIYALIRKHYRLLGYFAAQDIVLTILLWIYLHISLGVVPNVHNVIGIGLNLLFCIAAITAVPRFPHIKK